MLLLFYRTVSPALAQLFFLPFFKQNKNRFIKKKKLRKNF